MHPPATHRLTGGPRYLLTLAALLLPAIAWSSSWDWGLRSGIFARYDDNPTLRADEDLTDDDDIESTFAMVGSIDLFLQQRTRNRDIYFEPRITRDYYTDSDQEDLESTDYDLPLRISWQDPRLFRSISASYEERNILSDDASVLESGDFIGNELRADDTLTTYTVTGLANWVATQKDSFNLTAAYGKNDYDLDYTSRADRESYTGTLGYSRSITRRFSSGGSVTYSKFDAERLDCFFLPAFVLPASDPCGALRVNAEGELLQSVNTSFENVNENTSYNLTFDYTISPTLRFSGAAGKGKNDQEVSARSLDGTTIIPTSKTDNRTDNFRFELFKTLERGEWTLSASRTIRPATDGSTRDADTLQFKGDFEINRKLTARWLLRGSKSENVLTREVDDSLRGELKNFQGELRLGYQLDRKWSLSATYRYRWREDERLRTDAAGQRFIDDISGNSNSYSFGIFYTFKRIEQ